MMISRLQFPVWLTIGAALLVAGPPASARESLVPTQPSIFGAPGTQTPIVPREVQEKPTLLGPTDLPDTGGGDKPDGRPAPTASADLAFGAYQRGFYSTAMREAMKRLGRNPKDGPAMTLVGELYAQGLSVKQSKDEAARWFRLGAEAGDAQAMFELGIVEMKGDGVDQDREAARTNFREAAAQDHPGALFYLGLMAMQGAGVAPDYRSASAYFERAAALNNSEAQYALGLMYRDGHGVPKDETKAAKLLKAAADNDNVAAIIEFGIMQFNGIGVPKDEFAAARLFIKAAGRNNAVAQDRAARLYVAGRGVKKDLVEGMKWHLLASAAGLKDAWLDGEMRKLTPAEREAVDKAVRHYIGS